jgi:hypothetical protein
MGSLHCGIIAAFLAIAMTACTEFTGDETAQRPT